MVRTALFGDNVLFHFYQYCRGLARYWYQYHLAQRGFCIEMLTANVDWGTKLRQKITRLGGLERQSDNWVWPFVYAYALLGLAYFKLRNNKRDEDLAYFSWQSVAVIECYLNYAAPSK